MSSTSIAPRAIPEPAASPLPSQLLDEGFEACFAQQLGQLFVEGVTRRLSQFFCSNPQWLLFFAALTHCHPKYFSGMAEFKTPGELKRIWECSIEEGWQQSQMYDGFDAWIDYGCFQLRKDRHRLKLEWDNWTEGSIEGKRSTIEALVAKYEKTVSYEWRWSEYDDNVGTI